MFDLLHFVGEMLGYGFMRRALVAAVCVAVVAPLVGSFLVHREMAMIGETLAHTAFAGVAVGIFLGSVLDTSISPYVSALVVAVLAALLVQWLAERVEVYGDVSMAIVLAGGFAVGTVLIGLTSGGIAVSVGQYLFGSLSTLTRTDVSLFLVLSVVVIAVVVRYYRQLLYLTFDETGARVAGVDVSRYDRLLVVLTAVVVVGAMQLMGVILVAAMLVVPVAAANQVAGSFRAALVLSVAAAQVAALSGTTISYASGAPAGGTIVLAAIAVYAVAVVTTRLGGPRLG